MHSETGERCSSKTKAHPLFCFCSLLLCCVHSHIFRVIYHYMAYDLDATMILMIWTVKASTFAYNVADGQALNAGELLSPRESTHLFRSDRALTKLPGLLEYFSYVFFFGGVLVGPCFEAKEYLDFTSGALLNKHCLKHLPASILPALKCVLLALVMYAGVFVYSMCPMFGVVHTAEFGAWPFPAKFAYFWVAITASRFKYYFAWYFGDAGCVASGFGFNGIVVHEGKITGAKWDRVSNCDVLAVETAPHMSDVTNNWNMGVNNWLKNYVYFRVEAPRWVIKMGIPQKTFMNLVTKITSAFWHGFYPRSANEQQQRRAEGWLQMGLRSSSVRSSMCVRVLDCRCCVCVQLLRVLPRRLVGG